MANDLASLVDQDSAFSSVLKYLGRGGYAVRNLLKGNAEGAVRQGADLLGDTLDAFLPGDQISEFSRKGQDYTEASDLLGGMEPGIGKTAVDILGGVVTDPLSFVGGSVFTGIGKGLSAATKAAKAAPVIGKVVTASEKPFQDAGIFVRELTGNQRVAPEFRTALEKGQAVEGSAAAVATGATREAFQGLDTAGLETLSDVVQGIRKNKAGAYEPILPTDPLAPARSSTDDIVAQAKQRLSLLPDLSPEQASSVSEAIPRYVKLKQEQFGERVRRGVMNDIPGADLERETSLYMPRMFSGGALEDPLQLGQQSASGNTAKARTLTTPEEVSDFLNKNPDIQLERNAALAEGKYGQQQAKLLGKAAFAEDLVGTVAKRADEKLAPLSGAQFPNAAEKYKAAGLTPEEIAAHEARGSSLYTLEGSGKLKTAVPEIIQAIAKNGDVETARTLQGFWDGLPAREGGWKVLANINNRFKQFATAGAFIPRINFTVRNVTTGGMFQTLANPQARGQWGKYAKDAAGMILGAVDDGIEKLVGKRIGEDKFAAMNEAIRTSNGSLDKAIGALPPGPMQEALRHGVITDGFADAELLANEIARTGWKKSYADIRDWPSSIAQGSEKRMRYSVFEGLLDGGMAPEEAARIVKDTFYDYRIGSQANRAARDVIPFFAFTAKAVPQTAKLLKEQPWLIAATRPLFNNDPNAVLPQYLQNQVSIPLGKDEQGDPSYLTSLGLPLEVLSQLPNPSDDMANFGRQLRQGVVGAANPGIKAAYGLVTGRDPFFDSPFMSYDKTPQIAQSLGADERSEAARIYNAIAGTGVIQPIVAPVNVLSGLVDDKRSTGQSLINALTGAQIRSVDEDQALKQLVETYLQSNPKISRSQSFYSNDDNPEAQAVIKELAEIKKRLRLAREQGPLPP